MLSHPKLMISNLLKEKTDNTVVQLIRYTFVGGVAFVVDFGLLFLLTEYLNVYYLFSAGVAFLLGLTTNYILSVVWVFNIRRLRKKWLEFGIFAVVGIIGLGLNELFIWFFTEHVQCHYLLSKIISTFFVYLWNFFARKRLLFR